VCGHDAARDEQKVIDVETRKNIKKGGLRGPTLKQPEDRLLCDSWMVIIQQRLSVRNKIKNPIGEDM
jgi:hypothetical protein